MGIVSFFKRLIQEPKPHWIHAGLTFLITVLAAGVLLPLVRVQPESIHDYFNWLNRWIRISFAFSLCVVFTGVMFKLLTPRFGQLAHWKSYPPAWLAAVLAWIVVAVVDILGGFDSDGYRATVWEWIGYGGGSLLLVGWYSGLWLELARWFRKKPTEQVEATECITLQDIENAPWEEIEAWLESDEPARYDFLGNQSVAHRISFRVSEGTRSIGIVGPYGAGKTSIVSWVTDRLKRHEVGGRTFFVCQHSCWGFETSASAIHDMLGSAVSKLSEEIDTFQVDSLPESYRQTFSAGGDWVETISNLVLRTADPMEQFSRLSELLRDIGGRLIFIVEDLDRNETRNFEIQEVLAFLERLKECSNISFILTGGLSSSQRIDYAKLCDHIEFLRTIQPHHSSALIERVSQRCLDNSVYPHVRLKDPNRNYEWNPLSGLLMRDYEEFSLPQAVASLLNTPRSLRHALGRTFSAWQTLHGEIDFNHLIAVNILRFGAPECFQFLMRRWDRLHSPPNQRPAFGRERVEGIRQAIVEDWNHTIENVEWNPAAALQVMEFILPATEYWLVDNSRQGHSQSGQQHVSEERYWIRAINEAIEADDVRDQEVIRDIQDWIDSPSPDSDMISGIVSSSKYSDLWEHFAGQFFVDQPDSILEICRHTTTRLLREHGAAASCDSQGFAATWRFANRRVPRRAENRDWLQHRLEEAASISIEMVNSLWDYYGTSSRCSILCPEDIELARQFEISTLQRVLADGEALGQIIHSQHPYVLYQLVFDPGVHNPESVGDIPAWTWISQILLDALRRGNPIVAVGVSSLIATRESGSRGEPWTADPNHLFAFFLDDASDVVHLLSSLADQVEAEDQRLLVRAIAESARISIQERQLTSDEGEEDAD